MVALSLVEAYAPPKPQCNARSAGKKVGGIATPAVIKRDPRKKVPVAFTARSPSTTTPMDVLKVLHHNNRKVSTQAHRAACQGHSLSRIMILLCHGQVWTGRTDAIQKGINIRLGVVKDFASFVCKEPPGLPVADLKVAWVPRMTKSASVKPCIDIHRSKQNRTHHHHCSSGISVGEKG